MSLLVRKVAKGKWVRKDVPLPDPSADAITNDLKTIQNTLSFWKINDRSELHLAVLAIAAKFDHVEAFDVALLEESDIVAQGHSLEETPGETPFKDMVDQHRDITNLDYWGLGCVAESIITCFKGDAVIRYTATKVKTVLRDGLEAGDIAQHQLKPAVLSKLR